MPTIAEILARELEKPLAHVQNVINLLDEGNTIPFIARYRKELHGAMDDTALRTLEERLQYLRNLEERRETVKKAIEEQGKLTEDLSAAIDSAKTLAEVEDLYRPYKQKRRTRATTAREKDWSRWPPCCWRRSGIVPVRRTPRRPSSTRKGRGDSGRRIARRQRHYRRNAVGRRGYPQDPAGPADAAGPSPQPGRHGGGQRVPSVLRL